MRFGEAIGILHKGVLVFETEDMFGVFMDCCLYDWPPEGKSRVQRYAETHTLAPGNDERELLQAYLRAEYRILVSKARWRGGGSLLCRCILRGSVLRHGHRSRRKSSRS